MITLWLRLTWAMLVDWFGTRPAAHRAWNRAWERHAMPNLDEHFAEISDHLGYHKPPF